MQFPLEKNGKKALQLVFVIEQKMKKQRPSNRRLCVDKRGRRFENILLCIAKMNMT